jgi:hypothetical protein
MAVNAPSVVWTQMMPHPDCANSVQMTCAQGSLVASKGPNPNIYRNLGNLLSLKKQLQGLQQIEFGHSFGTAEKQGRDSESSPLASKTASGWQSAPRLGQTQLKHVEGHAFLLIKRSQRVAHPYRAAPPVFPAPTLVKTAAK